MDSLVEGTLSIKFMAQKIAIQGNMLKGTIIIMLRGLHKLNLDVSSDPGMLLGTPRVTSIIALLKRVYIHFSLEECMQRILEGSLKTVNAINCTF